MAFQSKLNDQVRAGLNELETKFDDKGATVLVPFGQYLVNLLRSGLRTCIRLMKFCFSLLSLFLIRSYRNSDRL